MKSSLKRRTRLALKIAAIVMLSLVIAGIAYEQVGERKDRKRYPQIGRSVNIGGRTLNIYCSGLGDPTVVLESGGHTAGYSWVLVQPQIAQFTRACWYDRAGYGWSDPGAFPRTGNAIASDLHALLRSAGIPAPYVLVGSNFGGFSVRVYNGLYPGEVAGMVLLDGVNPDQFAYEPHEAKGMLARLPRPVQRFVCAGDPILGRIGLARLCLRHRLWSSTPPPAMTTEEWTEVEQLSFQLTGYIASWSESCSLEENSVEARLAGNLGDRPLVVLTSAKAYGEDAASNELWVHKLQAELVGLSTRGRQVIVPSRGFGIEASAPGAVIEAARDVVTEVRKAQRQRQ
jgi:pimeloyl-ACP methyl ester carboxylesterase